VLVRRPRVVPDGDGRWLFAVDSRPGRERVLARHVTDDAELAHLVAPFDDAAADGWHEHDGPLYLVCTHGRHDRCCALRGRPVAQALGRVEPERTWECTHIGGDRFAANLVVLPDGLYLGRVEVAEVVDVVRGLQDGRLPAGRVRGRSSLSLPAQAAQQFAREDTGRWGTGDLDPVVQAGAGPDTWRVVLAGPGGPDVEVVVRFDRSGDGGEHLLTCGAQDLRSAPVFRRVALAAAPADRRSLGLLRAVEARASPLPVGAALIGPGHRGLGEGVALAAQQDQAQQRGQQHRTPTASRPSTPIASSTE
jgi:hypothetical protein